MLALFLPIDVRAWLANSEGVAHVVAAVEAADAISLVPGAVGAIGIRGVLRVAGHFVDHVPGVHIGEVLDDGEDVVAQVLLDGGAVVSRVARSPAKNHDGTVRCHSSVWPRSCDAC